jgi:hypothetical protein
VASKIFQNGFDRDLRPIWASLMRLDHGEQARCRITKFLKRNSEFPIRFALLLSELVDGLVDL